MTRLFVLCCLIIVVNSDFEECGVKHVGSSGLFAISGDGTDVNAPWLAAVGAMRNSSEGYEKFVVSCSGTILTRRIILTAAHCFGRGVPIYPEYVRAGVTRIDQKRSQDRKIQEVNIHPDHNNKDWYFDLALLFLEEVLIFTGRISPLCLPEKPFKHPGVGRTVSVQGWGEDINGVIGMQVSEATVTVRSQKECDYRFSRAGPSVIDSVKAFLPKLTNSTLICADSSLDSQAGACHGDSGGPAFIRSVCTIRSICQFNVFVFCKPCIHFLLSRDFVDQAHRFFIVGVVTGNPSTCFPKTLPDVINFVGNQKVSKMSNAFYKTLFIDS